MTMNEQINAEVILNKIHREKWQIDKGDNYPYIYTKADQKLLISESAVEDYGETMIDNAIDFLESVLIKSLKEEGTKDARRLTRLSRGIMKELGISSSRRKQIWDNAPPELIASLNAHQEFFDLVASAYDEIILDKLHMPLIKNHGGRMVIGGWQISKKMRYHTHRQAKAMIRRLNNEQENPDSYL